MSFFRNYEARVRLGKVDKPKKREYNDVYKNMTELPAPQIHINPDHAAELVQDTVRDVAISVTAAIVVSTAAIATGRIAYLVAKKVLQ